MEYQKIVSLSDNTTTQTSEFRAKSQVAKNVDARRTYNTISRIKFKNTKLNSRLCDNSDAFIPEEGTTEVAANTQIDKQIIQKILMCSE